MDRKFIQDYCIAVILLSLIMILAVLCIDKLVTPIASNDTSQMRRRIIVDAGHGGEDGGAVSINGILESELNLQIAVRLHDLLRLLGYDPFMLRTDDGDLHTDGSTIAQRKRSDLRERLRIINDSPNTLLISIHQNFFADSRYSGLQVFYAKTPTSKELAQAIQAEFKRSILPSSRRVVQKASNVYLMEHVTCPAVLVECGFLSNPKEESLLRSSEYQRKLCMVIASGIVNHNVD